MRTVYRSAGPPVLALQKVGGANADGSHHKQAWVLEEHATQQAPGYAFFDCAQRK